MRGMRSGRGEEWEGLGMRGVLGACWIQEIRKC